MLADWAANDCMRWCKDEDNFEYIPGAIKRAIGICEVSTSSEPEGKCLLITQFIW